MLFEVVNGMALNRISSDYYIVKLGVPSLEIRALGYTEPMLSLFPRHATINATINTISKQYMFGISGPGGSPRRPESCRDPSSPRILLPNFLFRFSSLSDALET
jgi:hypothetical protein